MAKKKTSTKKSTTKKKTVAKKKTAAKKKAVTKKKSTAKKATAKKSTTKKKTISVKQSPEKTTPSEPASTFNRPSPSIPTEASQNRARRPISAQGGIRAQTKSRKVGRNWWTKRWMAALEGLYMGAELPRGRAYAQGGQVLDIFMGDGEVEAYVQGAEKKPYHVKIRFKPTPQAKWNKVVETLSNEAFFPAKLLAGEMPEAIEDVFRKHKVSLFPSNLKDLDIECSFMEDQMPCRHAIAVFYLLAEEFDRDPFLFMKLRGFNREAMIDSIGKTIKRKTGKPDWLSSTIAMEQADRKEPIKKEAQHFWNGKEFTEELLGDVRIPPMAGALAKHLGHFPLWRGEERFLDALENVYKRASQNGMDVFMGDW